MIVRKSRKEQAERDHPGPWDERVWSFTLEGKAAAIAEAAA